MRFSEDHIRLDVPIFDDSQKVKQCKKKTPDEAYKSNDVVRFLGGKTLVSNKELEKGEWIFDTYDSYDNTCYITNSDSVGLTYNVCLTQIKRVVKLKDLLKIKKAKKQK